MLNVKIHEQHVRMQFRKTYIWVICWTSDIIKDKKHSHQKWLETCFQEKWKKSLKTICILSEVVYIKLLSQINAVLIELKRFNKIWKKIKNVLDKCKKWCILNAMLNPKELLPDNLNKFSKKMKKIQNSIWQKKKVCYIKLLLRFSGDHKQKWWSWKKFEKKSNFAWQS